MMTYIPIDTLSENISTGNSCAICGHPSLQVIHVVNFPDYIECSECHSAFILAEDGEHVLYGKIHPAYSETRKIALKQWIILAAVQQVSEMERTAPAVQDAEEKKAPEPEPVPDQRITKKPAPEKPAPAARATPAPEPAAAPSAGQEQHLNGYTDAPEQPVQDRSVEKAGSTPSFSALWKEEPMPSADLLLSEDSGAAKPKDTRAKKPAEVLSPDTASVSAGPPPPAFKSDLERAPVFIPHSMDTSPDVEHISEFSPPQQERDISKEVAKSVEKLQAQEPEPGIRYRVVLSGSQIKFPYKVCSHCMTSPARSSLSLTAFLPDAQDSSQRVPTPIRIPLCSRCRKRASEQSDEEKTQRSRAFLYSAGCSLLFILLLLITGIPARIGNFFLGSFLIVITASIGFGIPLLLLLERSNRLPPPADAFYVLSTLFLAPSPPQDMTIFDWRNRGYAELFHLANRSSTVKTVHQVEDQGPMLPLTPPKTSVAPLKERQQTPANQDTPSDTATENTENLP